MKKLYVLVGLICIATTAMGKLGVCFSPYHVRVINQSGGPAELKSSKDISGIRKGLKSAIQNNTTQAIVVDQLGASATFEVGPEDKETTQRINFYEKTAPSPMIVLKGNSIEAHGFNQHRGQQYTVSIRNESGGKAKVVDACEVSFKGDIEDRAHKDIKVRVGSSLILQMGPKGSKRLYKLRFSTPIEGGKPMIILQQGGWFRPAITSKDIRFGASFIPGMPSKRFEPKESHNHQIRPGACGKSRHVVRPDEPNVKAPAYR